MIMAKRAKLTGFAYLMDTRMGVVCYTVRAVELQKNMGYKKIITYTLQSESGVSLRASNFVCEGSAGGVIWSGNRCRDNGVPREKKIRWKRDLMKQITSQPIEESESK